MSLFSTRSITCEKCGNVYTMDEVGSINADRRPDLRQAILDDNFQDAVCPECGHSFRLEPLFTYLDVGRGQWLACYPARQMETYHNEEVAAQEMFDKSYGVDAPKAAQAIGGMLTPRITFGWPAAREKLLLHELGLDDVIVEMTKLDLMRRLEEAPLAPGIELRLVGNDNDRLHFEWVRSESEEVLSGLSVGKELYDVIEQDPEGWKEVREMLVDGMFVDMQKAYMSDGMPA